MKTVEWRLSLNSSPKQTYDFLNSSDGRARFWAESAKEENGAILFEFINSWKYKSKILERIPNQLFRIDYFNSEVSFHIDVTPKGGSDLRLLNTNISDEEYLEVLPGWVSVLMNLKAALDFDVDLRSHNPAKTWDEGYVDV